MDHHRSPAISEIDKRAQIKEKGKVWAGDVNDTNAWHSLVLAFDGGGIRGYAELLILQELMTRIVAWEFALNDRIIEINEILPCHYFDYMWGTSTGGLVALMLGRLRMSVPQALEVYRSVGDTIFGDKRTLHARGVNILATKFKHTNVKNAVMQITRDHCKLHNPCDAEDKLLWPDTGVDNAWDICQAVCVTARSTGGKSSLAQPLRSYQYVHPENLNHPDENCGIEDLDLTIWEAGRATSAAPHYFKMFQKVDVNGTLRRYKDGATLINNPAEKALNEVKDRYGLVSGPNQQQQHRRDPGLLLSIGTGIRDGTPFAQFNARGSVTRKRNKMWWKSMSDRLREQLAVAKHLVLRYTNSEDIHRDIRDFVENEHTWYRRLNVDVGLGYLNLGDWRQGKWHNPSTDQDENHPGGATLTAMENATRTYLTRTILNTENSIEWYLLPKEHIEHIAERLVRHRTERRNGIKTEEDRIRWHTHQGRWVTGHKMEDWDDFSCDLPYVYKPQEQPTKEPSNTNTGSSIVDPTS